MSKACVLLLLTMIAPIGLAALPTGNADDRKLDEKVDRLFAKWDRKDSPGCAVAILRDGKTIYQHCYGMADLENSVPISPSSVFNVGSMAKQFTAFCVLLLAEEGKLALDDDVRKYLPELPDYGEPITLRHLIHHTSGLREADNLLQFAGWRFRDLMTERDVLAVLSRQRDLNFRPGTEFQYANSNYTLLSVVIKKATGKSLREFTRERIFKPLGMSRTQFVVNHAAVVEGRAAGHVTDEGSYNVERPAYSFTGSSNLLSTVEDLAKWDANFYEPKVGSAKVVNEMTVAGRLKNGEAVGYGGGLFLGNYRKLRLVSHSGASIGFHAELLRFPDQHFSVIVLGNLFSLRATQLAQQVTDLYLAAEFPKIDANKAAPLPQIAPPPAAELQALTGLYWSERLASSVRFGVRDGQLQMLTGEGPFALVPIGPQEFQLPIAPRRFTFKFIPAGPDQPLRVRNEIEGQRPEEYEAVADAKPTFAELAAYAGVYYSDELNVTWNLEARDGRLFLHRRKSRDDPLKPVLANVFECGMGILRFKRAGDGRVTSFTVNNERTRHLRFLRTEQ
jgi:CubicO group peptidase (beta-lactamase class C family)